MPYADNNGVRIYYEVVGDGPPLVMQHGLGSNVGFWRVTGYVEPLKTNYRLILVDPRGHGSSDKPYDAKSYRMALRVSDVVAVLDDLGLTRACYLGYSAGGWVGWGIARYASERFRGLVIGGASPYGRAPEGLSFIDLFKQGMDATLAAIEQMFGQRWTPEVTRMFEANDLQALIALMSVDEDVDYRALLRQVSVPCLLFGGDEDPFYYGAEECASQMPNTTVVSLPGLDHIEAQYRPDLTIPHIRKFLAEVGEG